MNLLGQNIIVYDLEIKRPIEKCTKGWASLDEMGISVACYYDYLTDSYKTLIENSEYSELVARMNLPGTIIVGFNHVAFDNSLLRESGFPLKKDEELLNYDMLKISKFAEGGAKDTFAKGYKLDDHLKWCGLPMKTANGVIAPFLYEQRKMIELSEYCLNDVKVEKALFEYMQANGTLRCSGRPIPYKIKTLKDLGWLKMDEKEGGADTQSIEAQSP